MDIIIGTAGHIDHGKTALVKALTGIDADRFPEEKERGITIDIGFAELKIGEVNIGFVDVPGHEKFVKNMLAGAHGIDLVMLVVAADEGVMPQTREHFEICRLLDTKTGIIVLTKKDLADAELLEIAELDVAELVENSFLQNAPVVAVSSKTGDGVESLKAAIKELASKIPGKKNNSVSRLPIDRSFSVKGFGAVVTGTLVSGSIVEGGELEILPISKKVRVRGIQAHGKSVSSAHAGQRTAVNVGGIDHTEISRGMVLAEKDTLRPTQIIDAEIEVLKDAKRVLKTRQRVRLHIGTIEALARVQVLNDESEIKQGEKGFVQIRTENPIVAIPSDRIILRSYSPQITIAGGYVLDAHSLKHRKKDFEETRKFLNDLIGSSGDKNRTAKLYLESYGNYGARFEDLQARTGWQSDILKASIAENLGKTAIVEADGLYLARTPFDKLCAKTLEEVAKFHKVEPLAPGISRETLRDKIFGHIQPEIFRKVLRSLESAGKILASDLVRLASHNLELSGDEAKMREAISTIYKNAKLEVPKLDEVLTDAANTSKSDLTHARKIFQLLLNSGDLIKISEEFYFSSSQIDKLVEMLREYASGNSDRLIDVAKFKEIAGISRKYAIPLLEYFDRERVTRRAGDKRLIL